MSNGWQRRFFTALLAASLALNVVLALALRREREPAAPVISEHVIAAAPPPAVTVDVRGLTEASPVVPAATASVKTTGEELSPERKSSWSAERAVAELSQFVVLNDEQRSMLEHRLESSPALTRKERKEVISQVLGDDGLREYESRREEFRQRREAEEVDQEVFTLARKLSLDPTQEEQLREVLSRTREELRDRYEAVREVSSEAVALHTQNQPQQLRERYEEMKTLYSELRAAERKLLNERLQSVLSDEQMNALIEYQLHLTDPFLEE